MGNLEQRIRALESGLLQVEPDDVTASGFYSRLQGSGFHADPPLPGETREEYLARLPLQTLRDILEGASHVNA